MPKLARKYLKQKARLALVWGSLYLLSVPYANSQTVASPPLASQSAEAEQTSVVRGLLAQFQASLVRERRLADDRELRLIGESETRMRRARAALDEARSQVSLVKGKLDSITADLQLARIEHAKVVSDLAQRDNRLQAEIAAYRAEAQALAVRASPEKLAALQRFADGDRVGAWPVIKEITDATRRARDLITARANAADQRELARLRNIMRDNGEATSQEVLALWDEAAALDGSDFATQIERSRLSLEIGAFGRSIAALAQAENAARSDRERWVVRIQLGELQQVNGDLASARKSFELCLDIAEKVSRAEPESSSALLDLSSTLERVGDVQIAQGDLQAASRNFERSLMIREQLSRDSPSSSSDQSRLIVTLNKVGDVQVAQGNLPRALKSYGRSLKIAEQLSRADLGSATQLSLLAHSLERVGSVLVAQGDLAEARNSYEKSLAIHNQLSRADPSSVRGLRDLCVSLLRVGEVQVAQGDLPAGRKSYEKCLAIAERISLADRNSASGLRDLLVSLNRVGDVQLAQSELTRARHSYEQALQIADNLSRADPSSASALRDLWVGYTKVGEVQVAQGELAHARESYEKGQRIAERLSRIDPSSTTGLRDLLISLNRVGDVQKAQGDLSGAGKSYERGLHIAEKLSRADPSSAVGLRDLVVSYWKIASLTNTRTAWNQVIQVLDSMQAKNVLSPADRELAESARAKAAVATNP